TNSEVCAVARAARDRRPREGFIMINPQHMAGAALRRRLIVVAAMSCALVWAGSASAAVIAPVASCQSLATLDLSGSDAEVLSAQVSELQQHSYCDVTGVITPKTHFDVVLPTATWQGD